MNDPFIISEQIKPKHKYQGKETKDFSKFEKYYKMRLSFHKLVMLPITVTFSSYLRHFPLWNVYAYIFNVILLDDFLWHYGITCQLIDCRFLIKNATFIIFVKCHAPSFIMKYRNKFKIFLMTLTKSFYKEILFWIAFCWVN